MHGLTQHLSALAFLTLAQAAAAAPGVPNAPPAPPTAPLHPISYSFDLLGPAKIVGGGTEGILNITSITFTNFTSTVQGVEIFQSSTDGPGCTGNLTNAADVPANHFIVPADQTIQLTFPTALQVPHLAGNSCLGFAPTGNLNGGSINVLVNGLLTFKNGS